MRLIEGAIMPDVDVADASELDEMRAEIRSLRERLFASNQETAAAKREANRALANLRKQLNPLYQALQRLPHLRCTVSDGHILLW